MEQNVMIVDDEMTVRYSVRRILEHAGLKVTEVEDGESCINLLKKGFKGLILMDITMPGLDGWDTIQKIVDMGLAEGNIICMLTGKEKPDPKMDQLKEYVLDYIRKPFDNIKLIEIVKEYISYLNL